MVNPVWQSHAARRGRCCWVEQWLSGNDRFFINADAEKGQSGSPVWVTDGDKRYVVGLLVDAGETANTVVTVNARFLAQVRKLMGTSSHEFEEELEPEVEPATEAEHGPVMEAPYFGQAELLENIQEYENTPPKGLALLEHWHIPKTVASGGFHLGSLAVMKPEAMNPGFINADGELITDTTASGLQTCLRKLILDRFSSFLAGRAPTGPAANDRVHIAVADLTDARLVRPDFAGWGSTVARYGASSSKILAVYAAFQLRFDLRHMAKQESITKGDALAKFAVQKWKDEKLSRGFPNLEWLFGLKHWSGKVDELNFTDEARAAFDTIDHNDSASRITRGVNFPYIASAAWQSGLRHPTRGGLWLSRAYDGGDGWADNPAMLAPALIHNLTALSAATYFTLMAQGRLVDDATSVEIENVLSRGGVTCLYPERGAWLLAQKCGIFKPYMHDTFLAQHDGIRYAGAIMTELDAEWPGWPTNPGCPQGPETVTYTNLCRSVDTLIKNNNKTPKPTCG